MESQYEIAVLYDPGLEIDLEKSTDKVEKIFKDNAGKITKVDNWGKHKLAYPINSHDHSVYVFYTVELPGNSVRKIENALNVTDEVIRFLITKPNLKRLAKAEAEKADKAAKAAARGEQTDDKDTKEEE